jgi:D-lactate dehydrogenase (cytochrome)
VSGVELVGALRALLADPERVSVAPDVLADHGHDLTYHPARAPDVVVFPADPEEVQRIVRLANAERVPVVAFGKGTSVEGHVIPVAGGIVLDLSLLDRVLEVRPADFAVRVQAGVTRLALEETLRGEGVFFPVDPGADASIGGMVATNASGTNALRYGVMGDNVLGLEVVLADGSLVRTGGLAPKSSAGYDLTRLFVGSEGTLGIVTEAVLRLHPVPELVVAARAVFADVDAAVRTATRLIQTGASVARLELVDELTLRAVNAYEGSSYAEAPTLFLEFGGSETSVRHDSARAEAIATAEGAESFEAEADEESRARLWDARHHAALAVMATAPEKRLLSTDVCVPISCLPQAVREARRIAEANGVEGAVLGHVGDGNYHTLFMVDPDDPDEVARARRITADIVHSALALGGTCTGEHGIGLGKIGHLVEEHGDGIAVMQAVKRTLDPNGILNPGKVLPPDSG